MEQMQENFKEAEENLKKLSDKELDGLIKAYDKWWKAGPIGSSKDIEVGYDVPITKEAKIELLLEGDPIMVEGGVMDFLRSIKMLPYEKKIRPIDHMGDPDNIVFERHINVCGRDLWVVGGYDEYRPGDYTLWVRYTLYTLGKYASGNSGYLYSSQLPRVYVTTDLKEIEVLGRTSSYDIFSTVEEAKKFIEITLLNIKSKV